MFAVSAMSIQSVNAQDETEPKNAASSVSVKTDTKNPLNKEAISVPEKSANEAINPSKPKQQPDSEISPAKGGGKGEAPNTQDQDKIKAGAKIQAQNAKDDPNAKDAQKPAIVKEGTASGEEPTMKSAQNDNSGNGNLKADRKIKSHTVGKDEPKVKDAQKPAAVKEGTANGDEPAMKTAKNSNNGNGKLNAEKKHKNMKPDVNAQPRKKMKKSTTMKNEKNSKVVDKEGKAQEENATRPKEKVGTGTAQENEGIK